MAQDQGMATVGGTGVAVLSATAATGGSYQKQRVQGKPPSGRGQKQSTPKDPPKTRAQINAGQKARKEARDQRRTNAAIDAFLQRSEEGNVNLPPTAYQQPPVNPSIQSSQQQSGDISTTASGTRSQTATYTYAQAASQGGPSLPPPMNQAPVGYASLPLSAYQQRTGRHANEPPAVTQQTTSYDTGVPPPPPSYPTSTDRGASVPPPPPTYSQALTQDLPPPPPLFQQHRSRNVSQAFGQPSGNVQQSYREQQQGSQGSGRRRQLLNDPSQVAQQDLGSRQRTERQQHAGSQQYPRGPQYPSAPPIASRSPAPNNAVLQGVAQRANQYMRSQALSGEPSEMRQDTGGGAQDVYPPPPIPLPAYSNSRDEVEDANHRHRSSSRGPPGGGTGGVDQLRLSRANQQGGPSATIDQLVQQASELDLNDRPRSNRASSREARSGSSGRSSSENSRIPVVDDTTKVKKNNTSGRK